MTWKVWYESNKSGGNYTCSVLALGKSQSTRLCLWLHLCQLARGTVSRGVRQRPHMSGTRLPTEEQGEGTSLRPGTKCRTQGVTYNVWILYWTSYLPVCMQDEKKASM
jgi:hypothetical protein